MISLSKTLSFYKRQDIQEALVAQAKDKEVAFRFEDFFGKRPETLTYPEDVMELAKQKVTSFHCSEELWRNPLQLSTSMKKEELNALRKGWDLVLDIDCKFFEYSRLAAFHTIKALRAQGVRSITAKFSGNKGFHIAVPFEAFPKSVAGVNIITLFPDAPRKMAAYITELIRRPLADDIMLFEKNNFSSIMQKTGFKESEIKMIVKDDLGTPIPHLNVDPFLEIDTILISSRHLYRMPYSFHEKSELVSVPIDINKVLEFEKETALPEKVKVEHPFLDRNIASFDAEMLLRNALDFIPSERGISRSHLDEANYALAEEKQKEYSLPEKAIGEENFPPCIKLILNGLEDGKKRSCFALINFLLSCGWQADLIEKRLVEWNQKNREPLRDQYIVGQLRYTKQTNKIMPPPNCNNLNYYKGLQVCKPDDLCQKIKNPLQYAKRKEERRVRAEVSAPRRKKTSTEKKTTVVSPAQSEKTAEE